MDSKALQDVLVGVASSALWGAVSSLGARSYGTLKEAIGKNLIGDIYSKAAESISQQFPDETGKQSKNLERFLRSPEVESIVRQLYAVRAVGQKADSHIGSIQDEFATSFALHLDVALEKIRPLAISVFEALARECERQLSIAVKKQDLAAHDAKSSFRHTQLLGEIASITRMLELLRSRQPLDVHAAIELEAKYRAQVAGRHGFIQPPHLETARKFPIDELYVAPTFLPCGLGKGADNRPVDIGDFLAMSYRTVLLGNPGAGKSTYAIKLCHDLALQYEKRILANRLLTPVIVILREYGAQKRSGRSSILDFIESQAASRYQLSVPPGTFEYLLVSGRVAVIFDGLDELLDTSYRREISGDVESFCSLYPSVPVLVTSREVGYEQAPLDSKQFRLLRIGPFDATQALQYATKWFSLDDDLTPEQKPAKARAFLSESSVAPDLRSNPLMLGLMCNLYRAEGYIPRNRPEIYEKCSLMLFERWDKSRGITVPLPFEEHVRPAMQHLAFWIYSQEDRQGGVTESKLIDETSEYLRRWVFEDVQKARHAAAQFIEFCTGRAWVFTDTGTTAEGEKLFQFTHRTFLEYFAAMYLFSTHPTPGKLGTMLRPHIAMQEWDVVCMLAFQVQSRRVQGAGDQLVRGVLRQASTAEDERERWNLVIFACRCLESIVPSPNVRKEVATACLAACLKPRPALARARYGHGEAMVDAFRATSAENRSTLGETVRHALERALEHGSLRERADAYDFADSLASRWPLYSGAEEMRTADRAYWGDLSSRILATCSNECLETIAREELYIAINAYFKGKLTIKAVLDWHGPKGLFGTGRSRIFRSGTLPLLLLFSGPFSFEPRTENLRTYGTDMLTAAQFLLSTPPPWTTPQVVKNWPPYLHLWDERPPRKRRAQLQQQSDSAYVFTLFLTFAAQLECFDTEERARFKAFSEDAASRGMSLIAPALMGRFATEQHSGWKWPGLEEPYKSFVARWINKEISLVKLPRAMKNEPRAGAQTELEIGEC